MKKTPLFLEFIDLSQLVISNKCEFHKAHFTWASRVQHQADIML